MAADQTLTWVYTKDLYVESDIATQARRLAGEFDISYVNPVIGALLRLLVDSVGVVSTVEMGAGTGVSGFYLLTDGDVTFASTDAKHKA